MRSKYADCVRAIIRLPLAGETQCVIMEDWTVKVNKFWFVVPKGTQTDGASIPRILWRVCGHPLEAPRCYAAALHDWLYGGGVKDVTRAQADRCYYLLLRHFGTPMWKAKMEYWALRMFGWTHWLKGVAAVMVAF